MKVVRLSSVSRTRDHVHASWFTRLLLPMTAFLLICSVRSSIGQINTTQWPGRSAGKLPTVSKNQLQAPDKALHALERAQKYVLDGQLESAKKEVNRALDIAPHYGAAKAIQGGIYLKAENYDEAAKWFQGALDDDPASGAAYAGMAVILIRQKRFQAALPLLDRAEGLLPGAWFVHFVKAWAQLGLGSTDAALKQADYAEQSAGTNSEKKSGVSYLRAMICLHLNDLVSARKYLAEAVARDRSSDYAALAKTRLERLQPLLAAKP